MVPFSNLVCDIVHASHFKSVNTCAFVHHHCSPQHDIITGFCKGMLFCHRGSKAATPPLPVPKPHNCPSPGLRDATLDGVDTEEWRLPSILTAGSLDELSTSNSLPPEAPEMPADLEAQLATLSNRGTDGNSDGKPERSMPRLAQHSKQLLGSVSMHSLVFSITSQDYTRNQTVDNCGIYFDGNLSLPITHKKHHHHSGLSLLSLGHHRSNSSTLRKLRSLDVQQFSSLLDFEERYNDPWVGSIS